MNLNIPLPCLIAVVGIVWTCHILSFLIHLGDSIHTYYTNILTERIATAAQNLEYRVSILESFFLSVLLKVDLMIPYFRVGTYVSKHFIAHIEL